MTSNNFEIVFSIRRNDKSYSRQLSNRKFEFNYDPKKPVRVLKKTVFLIACYLAIPQYTTSHMPKSNT